MKPFRQTEVGEVERLKGCVEEKQITESKTSQQTSEYPPISLCEFLGVSSAGSSGFIYNTEKRLELSN